MACNDEFCLLVWYYIYIYIYKTLSCCSFCGRKCLLSEISGNKLDTWISSCCHWNWFNLHIMTILYLFLAEKGFGIWYIIHEVGALEYHWERILQPWTNRFLNSVVVSFGIQVSETKKQVHIIQTKSQWLLIPDLIKHIYARKLVSNQHVNHRDLPYYLEKEGGLYRTT